MSRLLASLYLDEDVPVLLGAILHARGFCVATARNADQLGRSDRDQLLLSASSNLVLLTHNRVDFQRLHREWLACGMIHAGILVARRRLPHESAARAGRLLTRLSPQDLRNQLFFL